MNKLAQLFEILKAYWIFAKSSEKATLCTLFIGVLAGVTIELIEVVGFLGVGLHSEWLIFIVTILLIGLVYFLFYIAQIFLKAIQSRPY